MSEVRLDVKVGMHGMFLERQSKRLAALTSNVDDQNDLPSVFRQVHLLAVDVFDREVVRRVALGSGSTTAE